jgi:hypothetical protein
MCGCTAIFLRTWTVCFHFQTRETRRVIYGDAHYMAITADEARQAFAREWGYMQPTVDAVGVESQ